MERVGDRQEKMERYCATGQSPQRAVVPMEEEEEQEKEIHQLTLILPCSRTGTVWFYTSTSNKRAARPKLYTKSLTWDLKRTYSRLTLVRISIKL